MRKIKSIKHRCDGKLYDPATVSFSQCYHPGKYLEQGKWWCGIHAPSRMAARAAKRDKAYEAEETKREKENKAELNQQAENIWNSIKGLWPAPRKIIEKLKPKMLARIKRHL